MSDLNRAKTLLQTNEQYTCVLCCGEETLTDDRRGVRPLLDFLERSRDWRSYCAADKVVGKAAAFLYQLMGIQALYAHVVSEPAVKVLENAGIALTYDTLVPAIRNRTDTGFCPMETAVWDVQDPEEALTVLKITLENLKNTNS
jgi:hypothetical protein